MKTIAPFFWAALLFVSLSASAADLPNYHSVDGRIFRSGRPTQEGLKKAQQDGITTIVNIEDSMSNVRKEEGWAKALGLRFYSIPLSAFTTPADHDVERILELLDDPSLSRILVHCKHGEDRTGMIIGLRRVFVEKWSPEQAYQEMLDLGFHPILKGLDRYFRDKTSWGENGFTEIARTDAN
jgi:protein tyrosine/serine phosphatase